MDLAELIAALSKSESYPFAVDKVEVHQTHISVVFLAGPYAYKIKKPVNLGYLDFSSLEKRRHFCEEEVRLNRRLAPEVYLGVVSVARQGDTLHIDGDGQTVDWAVKMVRLPAEATLESRLQRGEVTPADLESLARRLAAFHCVATTSARIAGFGRLAVVAQNARENFEQVADLVGRCLSQSVMERLRERTELLLEELGPCVEERAERGMIRDTHGDLHLDHVYLFPERGAPADVTIVDCIEFNERFRFADPVADMAFLFMDLCFHGRRDLAARFAAAWFEAMHDDESRRLLPFYSAYRAMVRGKVEGLELDEAEIPAAEKDAALLRARGHFLLALGELEPPTRKPALVLVAGLPGTGKSTLAKSLSTTAGFTVLRTDVIRNEITAGQPTSDRYTPDSNERTYAECLRRAEPLLFEGQRVLIDANFRQDSRRCAFLEASRRWCVPGLILICEAEPDTIRHRLASRHGDASDADLAVYQKLAEEWEPPSQSAACYCRYLQTEGSPNSVLARALNELARAGLYECFAGGKT